MAMAEKFEGWTDLVLGRSNTVGLGIWKSQMFRPRDLRRLFYATCVCARDLRLRTWKGFEDPAETSETVSGGNRNACGGGFIDDIKD